MGKTTKTKKDTIKSKTSIRIMYFFAGVFVVLFIVFILVILFDCVASLVGGTLDVGIIHPKAKTIQVLGWMMSGTLGIIGAFFLNWRADAQISVAGAQVKNNELIRKGHTQERFKTATEHLGHLDASVRIAAFHEFLHLIKTNGKEYRKSILDILYAHTRTAAYKFENSQDVKEAKKAKKAKKPINLTEEIQELLNVLFKSQGIKRSDIKPNLQGVYLPRANLIEAKLRNADLTRADLSRAKLTKADLTGADLTGADLSRAKLIEAKLIKAKLIKANLTGAKLAEAKLTGAKLIKANLTNVKFPGADLSEADLSGADLSEADLSGADLSTTQLGKAFYTNATTFPPWIKESDIPRLDINGKGQFAEEFTVQKKPKSDE